MFRSYPKRRALAIGWSSTSLRCTGTSALPSLPDGFNLETAVGRQSIAQVLEPIGARGIPTCTQRVHGRSASARKWPHAVDGPQGRPPWVPATRAVAGATGDAITRRSRGCAKRPEPTVVSRLNHALNGTYNNPRGSSTVSVGECLVFPGLVSDCRGAACLRPRQRVGASPWIRR